MVREHRLKKLEEVHGPTHCVCPRPRQITQYTPPEEAVMLYRQTMSCKAHVSPAPRSSDPKPTPEEAAAVYRNVMSA